MAVEEDWETWGKHVSEPDDREDVEPAPGERWSRAWMAEQDVETLWAACVPPSEREGTTRFWKPTARNASAIVTDGRHVGARIVDHVTEWRQLSDRMAALLETVVLPARAAHPDESGLPGGVADQMATALTSVIAEAQALVNEALASLPEPEVEPADERADDRMPHARELQLMPDEFVVLLRALLIILETQLPAHDLEAPFTAFQGDPFGDLFARATLLVASGCGRRKLEHAHQMSGLSSFIDRSADGTLVASGYFAPLLRSRTRTYTDDGGGVLVHDPDTGGIVNSFTHIRGGIIGTRAFPPAAANHNELLLVQAYATICVAHPFSRARTPYAGTTYFEGFGHEALPVTWSPRGRWVEAELYMQVFEADGALSRRPLICPPFFRSNKQIQYPASERMAALLARLDPAEFGDAVLCTQLDGDAALRERVCNEAVFSDVAVRRARRVIEEGEPFTGIHQHQLDRAAAAVAAQHADVNGASLRADAAADDVALLAQRLAAVSARDAPHLLGMLTRRAAHEQRRMLHEEGSAAPRVFASRCNDQSIVLALDSGDLQVWRLEATGFELVGAVPRAALPSDGAVLCAVVSPGGRKVAVVTGAPSEVRPPPDELGNAPFRFPDDDHADAVGADVASDPPSAGARDRRAVCGVFWAAEARGAAWQRVCAFDVRTSRALSLAWGNGLSDATLVVSGMRPHTLIEVWSAVTGRLVHRYGGRPLAPLEGDFARRSEHPLCAGANPPHPPPPHTTRLDGWPNRRREATSPWMPFARGRDPLLFVWNDELRCWDSAAVFNSGLVVLALEKSARRRARAWRLLRDDINFVFNDRLAWPLRWALGTPLAYVAESWDEAMALSQPLWPASFPQLMRVTHAEQRADAQREAAGAMVPADMAYFGRLMLGFDVANCRRFAYSADAYEAIPGAAMDVRDFFAQTAVELPREWVARVARKTRMDFVAPPMAGIRELSPEEVAALPEPPVAHSQGIVRVLGNAYDDEDELVDGKVQAQPDLRVYMCEVNVRALAELRTPNVEITLMEENRLDDCEPEGTKVRHLAILMSVDVGEGEIIAHVPRSSHSASVLRIKSHQLIAVSPVRPREPAMRDELWRVADQ